jgi:hypothetical protein
MKNIKLAIFSSIVFLFVWTGDTLAQNVPFPESNAVWKVSQTTIAGPIFHYVALCGELQLNGFTYYQVSDLQVDDQLNVTSVTTEGKLRKDGEKVYYWPNWSQSEYLIYDFGLEAGDVISIFSPTFGENIDRHVDSVGVEQLAGLDRKVIYFTPSNPFYAPERWMAGIGSSTGPLSPAAEPGADIGGQLFCFQHGTAYHNEYPIEDCRLPELPAECAFTDAAHESIALEPLKITAQPNPSGAVAVRFTTNLKQLPEPCNLKIYAANGKLLATVANAQPETMLPADLVLGQGFHIATLESDRTERVLAHCTFMVAEPK